MDSAPSPLPVVTLKIERRSSHPWIFQKMVEKPSTRIAPGSVVDIHEKSGAWVARGLDNGHPRIPLRVLTSKQDEPIDADFSARKLTTAISFRRDVLKLDAVTTAYRLVHSEADGLSGLVVDRFGDTVVIEFFAAGMFKHRAVIMDALRVHFPAARF